MRQFYAKVETYNHTSEDKAYNTLTVKHASKELETIAIDAKAPVTTGEVYHFEVEPNGDAMRERPMVTDYAHFYTLSLPTSEKETIMRKFYAFAPVSHDSVKETVEGYIARMNEGDVRTITLALFRELEDEFYLYPAATRFHHAYIGGLAHHTATMLKMVDGFVSVYPFLDETLLIGGILLHDLHKTSELSNYHAPSYTTEGKLLGHLSMGSDAVGRIAREQGLYESEARILLQHMVVSHHYYGNFGSPKKPNTPEALALHFIDNIDSKFAVLGEQLKAIKSGEFTPSLGVLDRERYYKPKGNN